jgi:hypothetical protein
MDALIPIESKFLANGWSSRPKEEIAPLNAVFDSNYEIVGLLIANTLDTFLEKWGVCQDKMRELGDPERQAQRDLYLIVIIPQIEDRFDKVAEVLSNSHVCRKICLETHDGNLESSLADLPFFKNKLAETDSETDVLDPVIDSISKLSSDLREDLSKRDKEIVLEKLIAGDYADAPAIADQEEVANED